MDAEPLSDEDVAHLRNTAERFNFTSPTDSMYCIDRLLATIAARDAEIERLAKMNANQVEDYKRIDAANLTHHATIGRLEAALAAAEARVGEYRKEMVFWAQRDCELCNEIGGDKGHPKLALIDHALAVKGECLVVAALRPTEETR